MSLQGNLQDHAASVSAAASKATYAGSATAGIGAYMTNEMAVAVGVLVAIAGFVVNWYYKHQDHLRKERESEARLREIRAGEMQLQEAGQDD